jgi:hypothetical protein
MSTDSRYLTLLWEQYLRSDYNNIKRFSRISKSENLGPLLGQLESYKFVDVDDDNAVLPLLPARLTGWVQDEKLMFISTGSYSIRVYVITKDESFKKAISSITTKSGNVTIDNVSVLIKIILHFRPEPTDWFINEQKFEFKRRPVRKSVRKSRKKRKSPKKVRKSPKKPRKSKRRGRLSGRR